MKLFSNYVIVDHSSLITGIILLIVSCIWFFSLIFVSVGSKILTIPTGNKILDAIASNWYYPNLLVMWIPATLVGIYLNWLAMKFFRHN